MALKRQKFETARAPINPLPYSQAIIADDFLYTAGQVPVHPESGQLGGRDRGAD